MVFKEVASGESIKYPMLTGIYAEGLMRGDPAARQRIRDAIRLTDLMAQRSHTLSEIHFEAPDRLVVYTDEIPGGLAHGLGRLGGEDRALGPFAGIMEGQRGAVGVFGYEFSRSSGGAFARRKGVEEPAGSTSTGKSKGYGEEKYHRCWLGYRHVESLRRGRRDDRARRRDHRRRQPRVAGLRKGVVINIESTVSSIKRAVQEAALMAGCEIHTVFAAISGGHIKSFNSHGIVAVKNKEVTQRDLDRVIDAAKAVAIPLDREVLHVLPQDYIIDEQDGIKEPLGMSGVRLEAKVHVVTGAVTSVQNIVKCCNRSGLNVAEIVLTPLAAAEAVLTDEERELGVVLVDMGGGTTDITVFHDGTVKHTAVLSIGGNHVTNDIAAGLRTPFGDAERIKQRYGFAKAAMAMDQERVEVPSIAGKEAGTRVAANSL